MSILKLEQVEKVYKLGKTEVQALRGVDLTVDEGDFACVVGPSGSGKTTLLNLIGCLDKPTRGKLWFLGEHELGTLSDIKATQLRRHKIGFIFQNFNLLPVLDIIENIELPLIMMGLSHSERKKRSHKMIEAVGLSEHIKHKPSELSGGQQQRVAIARALISEPKLVLADEPTANLDSVTSAQILELMGAMNRQLKTTFIFSTHDPDVMERAQKRIYIHDGRIQRIELNHSNN